MEIQDLIEDLVDRYAARFPATMGELCLRRVTASPPEAVNEWPWMYFVVESGDAVMMTYATLRNLAPTRLTTPPEVARNALILTHQFKAQLLVRPRTNVVEDDRVARLFITPVLQVAAESFTGDGLIHFRATGYRYGAFPFGTVDKPVEFIGCEFAYEARLEA